MSWPRRYHFKFGNAGEVKAFKCLTLRKKIISLENPHEVIWTSEKGIISFVNTREVILTSKKGAVLLVTRKKAVSLGKGTSFQPDLKWSHSGRFKCEATQAQSYSEARIYPSAKLFRSKLTNSSWANLVQPGSGAKGDVHTHTPPSKYFRIWSIPL